MIGQDLNRAARILKEGGLVAVPTETVYGLAGNATSSTAVSKIFSTKERPSFNPLIVHFGNIQNLKDVNLAIPEKLLPLAKAFWPGPITLLVKRSENIPEIVTAGLDTVAVRIPAKTMMLDLLKLLDFPLAAPSANPFGKVSPVTAQQVENMFGNKLEYILDGGKSEVGVESTVVGLDDEGNIQIFRNGGITQEEIEEIVGPVKTKLSSSKPSSPGQLIRHYSPGKKVMLGKKEELLKMSKNAGVLNFKSLQEGIDISKQRVLSESGDFHEAASNLFTMMRELASLDIDVIIAEKLPDESLGRAINDRLQRASDSI